MSVRTGTRAVVLLRTIGSASCRCPAHSTSHNVSTETSTTPKSKDYAFQVKTQPSSYSAHPVSNSTVRYGPGVNEEVGMDLVNMKLTNVCVMTDQNLVRLPPVKSVLNSLAKNRVKFKVYDRVQVEPTDSSMIEAASFVRQHNFDGFVSVGGGSVIDTCKAANLYSCDREADFLDYVNAPIGKGKKVDIRLKPHIAVPTTSGTGSESTGVAIFDYEPLKVKTGISHRGICPTLGIIDPLHTLTMPERVSAYSGFDVLCHALESYTAIPYNERSPRPSNPNERPTYNGQNPVSDIWAKFALDTIRKYFKRSVYNHDDVEARSNMHLAATMAGVGFGNAGVHLCHAMSYPIAGNVKAFQPKDYSPNHPLVPHGLGVVMTSPAVFKFTSDVVPDRHIEAARLLGCEVQNPQRSDAGKILSDTLREYMHFMKVENGLTALGYGSEDIPKLVEGTLPQKRLTEIAPREQSADDLASLFEQSLTVY